MTFKGKPLTLGSKIFGALWIVGAFVLSAIFEWGLATEEIIKVGLAVVALFSPVDISMILEKFGRRGSRV